VTVYGRLAKRQPRFAKHLVAARIIRRSARRRGGAQRPRRDNGRMSRLAAAVLRASLSSSSCPSSTTPDPEAASRSWTSTVPAGRRAPAASAEADAGASVGDAPKLRLSRCLGPALDQLALNSRRDKPLPPPTTDLRHANVAIHRELLPGQSHRITRFGPILDPRLRRLVQTKPRSGQARGYVRTPSGMTTPGGSDAPHRRNSSLLLAVVIGTSSRTCAHFVAQRRSSAILDAWTKTTDRSAEHASAATMVERLGISARAGVGGSIGQAGGGRRGSSLRRAGRARTG
jgi:hypothetical protein